MTILVIEDSRFLRTAIERCLLKAEHRVIAVGDGQEGLRQAQDLRPDVIVLDMMLPTMDGTSVLSQLKQNVLTKSIPVIILSGLSQKNEKKLKMSGAAAYFEKNSLKLEQDGNALVQAIEQLTLSLP
jgi:two-component system alkaline phosphatase synthesis response regulator PhoP